MRSDPFIMAWDVCNIGGADANSHETRLDLSDGQSTVSTTTVTVPQLPPGVCWRATVPFDKGLAASQYDAMAMEDSNGAIAESNEANNYFNTRSTFSDPSIPGSRCRFDPLSLRRRRLHRFRGN